MTKDLAVPKEAPLEKIPSRTLLAGHPNHLTDEQFNLLNEFKKRLSSAGYYHDSQGDKPASHDEAHLLRFLRARKFDLEGALHQFEGTETWRKTEKVNEVYSNFPVEEFKEAQSLYPQWTGRRDKNGLALYVYKVGALSKESTNAYAAAEDRITPRTIALYELMNQFVIPFTNALPREHPESPITATSTIVDISGVSLSRFWNLRDHMSRVSVLASNHYPETLGAIYLVGAPGFFSVVWGWISKWFDENTRDKIHIIKAGDVFTVLSANIDVENIPISFGGKLDFNYGDNNPILDQEAKDVLGLNEIPRGSIRWNNGKFELLGSGRSEEEIRKFTPKTTSISPSTSTSPSSQVNGEKLSDVSNTTTQVSGVSTTNGTLEEEFYSNPLISQVQAQVIPPSPTTSSPSPLSTPPTSTESASDRELLVKPFPITNSNSSTPIVDSTNSSSKSEVVEDSKPTPAVVESESKPAEVVEEEKHDIWTSAREEPGAPVKELAAVLEGTTL